MSIQFGYRNFNNFQNWFGFIEYISILVEALFHFNYHPQYRGRRHHRFYHVNK